MDLSLYHSRASPLNGIGCIKTCLFKKARETATKWRSILCEGRGPIKERNKQKREAISNLQII
ncbi:hypothetical protein MCY_00548 [Bartonella rattimassiliensis 15908]|uniref:Uncharacterized protein n=1 Tax=Bartonella rattimassiliensis 15908 TaxID=1094556 RepID=J0ZFT4_9HYPH|nr:hypothetical protein MCY_00548 [Bartonella rattimassiliensis 15908]